MPWFIQYRAALPLTNKEIGSDLAQLKVTTCLLALFQRSRLS